MAGAGEAGGRGAGAPGRLPSYRSSPGSRCLLPPGAFGLLLTVLLVAACGVPRQPGVAELAAAARAGDEGAVARLVARMGRGWDEPTRASAYRAVLELGDRAREAVRKACRSPDPVLREHALAVAGNRRWPWVFGEALEALGDPSFARRYVGAWALGELGRLDGAPALVRALGEGGDVAREATRALVKLGAGAVPDILEGFARLPPAGRVQAVLALGDIRDPRAAPVLLRALAPAETRAEAAWALGKLDDPAFAQALVPLLSDPAWRVRVEAVRALGALEYRPADTALDRLRREDPVRAVREWAARSLALIRKTPQTYPDDRGRPVPPDNVYR